MKLDIAPFASKESSPDGRITTLRWEEPRELHSIVLRFAENAAVPQPKDIHITYWRHNWPNVRVSPADLAKGNVGSFGWRALDDWFNGEWQKADISVRVKDREAIVTFQRLGRREFPDLKQEYNVRFRQALKLQVQLPEGCAEVTDMAILSDTNLRARSIAVELNCGTSVVPWDGKVEVYNGVLRDLQPPDANDPRLRMTVEYAQAWALSGDHTVITVRSSAASFSFRPEDLDTGQPIWVPDLGALVSETAQNVRYSPEFVDGLKTGVTRYDAVLKQPEQSLGRAMREQQPKDSMHFIVSCEGARQKFGVAPNGDIFVHEGWLQSVPRADTERLGWEGHGFALRFGWDRWQPSARKIVHGYIPLLEESFSNGALDIRQVVFSVPLDQSILAGEIAGDATTLCLARLTFVNNSSTAAVISQPFDFFNYKHAGAGEISRGIKMPMLHEALQVRGDEIWAVGPKEHFRMLLDTRGKGALVQDEEAPVYRLELTPNSTHSIIVKLPFLCQLTTAEIERMRQKHFEKEQTEVIQYWQERIAHVCEIVTPEPDINDFSRSHLIHTLINDDFEIGSRRIIGRVSSFHYGNFSNETVMQLMELDRRGMHEEARRHYETFLHYQGTVGLPGNFKSKEGIFYGSGGYENGDYNQHHGWVLWGLAEHYRFTGDREWLLQNADKLIAGCEWVIRERQATKQFDSVGKKILEYGFMPAGSLEDVTDFYYWLSTNCLTSRGVTAAAEALAEAGHPEGVRMVQEAKAFQEDLLAGYRESMVRCPVVKLRDGTYVPHFPSRLYLRGRDFGWLREVLEGAMSLTTTVLDPAGQETTWIMKDYEDNLYCDAPFNYQLEDFDRDWFSRGGFSMQPNLVYFTPPYLLRDQIEHFLRAYFNGFTATFRRDIRAMSEHELPTLYEWAGDHFKSSDESMTQMWLRMMYIMEEGSTLSLGRGLPWAWVGSKDGIAIRNAATYFGPMSLEMRADKDMKRIAATIDPPTRKAPEKIVLRFRHPEKAKMVKVLVNGQPAESFDAEKEWVILPALQGKTQVEAYFEQE